MAIVGRANVGKSSLLNALTGEGRALVAPEPGTTRDPVDSIVPTSGGRMVRLIDTAGMRRRVRIDDPVEYFSLLRARRTLERSDVVLLVVDAVAGVTAHDQRLAQEVVTAGRACVVVLNKWDVITDDHPDRSRLERAIEERLRFLAWARRVRTSALTGRGVRRLLPAAEDAVASHRRRVTTSVINRIVHVAQDERPHPRSAGRATRVLYAVQTGVGPPTFALFARGALEPAYLRYLERRIREAIPFEGTPVRLAVRPSVQ